MNGWRRYGLAVALLASGCGPRVLGQSSGIGSGMVIEVGPGRAYPDLQSVAYLLKPGDIVELQGGVTYPGEVLFKVHGTPKERITIRGVRVGGRRPIISGGVRTISMAGDYYRLEGLDVTGGSEICILHQANEIEIFDSVIHHCPKHGLLGADSGSGSLTMDHVEVHHSGYADQKHPIYMATDETLFPNSVFRMQYSYLHDQNGGNNIKTRAERNEIYYNWIEGGFYRELELIGPDGQDEQIAREDSDVVGNVIVKTQGSYSARIGGDGTGDTGGRYRFVNNTFILRADSNGAIQVFDRVNSLEMHNNVFYALGGGGVAVVKDADAKWTGGKAFISARNNWIANDSTYVPEQFTATITGTDPGFVDVARFDVRLKGSSPLIDAGVVPSGKAFNGPLFPPAFQPPLRRIEPAGVREKRPSDGHIDIGAFERGR